MLMRLVIGACIFSLGYYIGRESALKDEEGILSEKRKDYIKGNFTDVDDEAAATSEEN